MPSERERVERLADAWGDVPDPLVAPAASSAHPPAAPAVPSPTRGETRVRRIGALVFAVAWGGFVLSLFGLREGFSDDAGFVLDQTLLWAALLVSVLWLSMNKGHRGLGVPMGLARAVAIGAPLAFMAVSLVWLPHPAEGGFGAVGPFLGGRGVPRCRRCGCRAGDRARIRGDPPRVSERRKVARRASRSRLRARRGHRLDASLLESLRRTRRARTRAADRLRGDRRRCFGRAAFASLDRGRSRRARRAPSSVTPISLVVAARLGPREGSRLQDLAGTVGGSDGRPDERRQVDAVEIERAERSSENGDALARCERVVDQNHRLPAQPAEPAAGTAARDAALHRVVAHRDPEPSGQGFQRGDELEGLQTMLSVDQRRTGC